MADRVVRCIHQKMAAYVEFWPGKVACHKIFNLSTFVLPKISCAVICQCFSATYCCVGNGSPLSLIHASMKNPHPNFNYNLIVMWKALIVNGFWWNLNMLFILVVSNSLGNLFEINQSWLNCCVVKKVAFVISRSCSAPQCGGYLRDLALFDQPL